jgi:uncharacterized protein
MSTTSISRARCFCLTTAFSLILTAFLPAASAASYTRLTSSQVITNAIPYAARPLPLTDIRLTGGPLKHAQDLDADYLLKLDPDRMLYYLRLRAGLRPKASQGYGGWDGEGRQLTGHIAGHYLSAISYMYAATGDVAYKIRADYIVRELKEIQDAHGDGYIGGLMANAPRGRSTNSPPASSGTNAAAGGRRPPQIVDGKQRFQELADGVIQSSGFDLNGMWSPWYVQHKLYAGLRDAYRLTGNPTALQVEIKFAEWADGILSKLNDAQIQRMLNTEFGAMNEIMADLYADTGDPRWRRAYNYFEHRSIVEPLARHEDILPRKHGNTQVPKLLGDLMFYIYTGDRTNGEAAKFFWERVANHHSFATGGHGRNEYFGQPDKLNDMVDGRTAETCNVYNMLKLTRQLFALQPDARYAEFHERALFNHILASIDPEDGRTCYMVPVGRGVQHEYANMFQSFTCCVGTGMESHALHADGVYFESGDKLWVNLYTPSIAEWKTMGVLLDMQTDFPEGEAVSLKLTVNSRATFTIALRRPSWAGEGFEVRINGRPVGDLSRPGSYVELSRTWKSGDTISLTLPKTLHEEPLVDNPRRVALMWGPLVLAGDLGPGQRGRRGGGGGGGARGAGTNEVPVFVAADRPLSSWLKPVAGKPGRFRSDGVGRDKDVEFVPFYQLHRSVYGIYWDTFTPAEWQKKSEAYASETEKRRKLDAATVAFAQPGEMQPERDYNFQGEDAELTQLMGRPARRGSKWFSFDLPVEAGRPMVLIVTYNSEQRDRRSFEIQADGQRIGEQVIERQSPEQVARFFDVEYPLAAELTKDKTKVTVRFQAVNESEIAAVFGVRMVRGDAER